MNLKTIIKMLAKAITKPTKQDTLEKAACDVLDRWLLAAWQPVLEELRAGERSSLQQNIRGAIIAAYKEGYRRGKKHRKG